MSKEPTLIHERIDDIPLLIGLAQKLRLAEIMDKHLGNHGNHEGLSNGTLAIVWIAYILSEQNHKKVQVQEWSIAHKHTLEILLNQPIRDVEFSDDRLGIVLRRLSDQKTWEELQSDLWKNTAAVYEIEEVKSVRLDTTTVSGYHEKVEEGIMQNGHSKNHRPDLPQIKLMAACAEPSGHLLGCNVLPGNKGDEPLYVPMIERMQKMLGRNGLLYAGDSKMAAIETRAKIVGHQDYYLMPLPMIGETAQEIENWIGAVVDGTQEAQMIWRDKELLGGGYEFSRELSYILEEEIHWIERVQIVRSYAFAQPQIDHLEKRLAKAKQELQNLTPAPGRGKRQYKEETSLQEAVSAILEKYKVVDLLSATWDRQEITQTDRKSVV